VLIGSGAAAVVKLALNQLIASLSAAFALSLGFVQRQGIDIELFMQILRDSALMPPHLIKVAADARPQLCGCQLSD